MHYIKVYREEDTYMSIKNIVLHSNEYNVLKDSIADYCDWYEIYTLAHEYGLQLVVRDNGIFDLMLSKKKINHIPEFIKDNRKLYSALLTDQSFESYNDFLDFYHDLIKDINFTVNVLDYGDWQSAILVLQEYLDNI